MSQHARNNPDEPVNQDWFKGGSRSSGPIQVHTDTEIGMTMGETTVIQLQDGTWKATTPIGTIFGSEVEGECSGTGATREAALEALTEDRKKLNDSLWA